MTSHNLSSEAFQKTVLQDRALVASLISRPRGECLCHAQRESRWHLITCPAWTPPDYYAPDGAAFSMWVPFVSKKSDMPVHMLPAFDRMTQLGQKPFRLIVRAPPRHAVSTSLLHFGVWAMAKTPRMFVGYGTHAPSVIKSKLKHARDIARLAGLRFGNPSVPGEGWGTSAGGGMMALTPGSPVEIPLHLAIIDSPFSNNLEAVSLAHQEVLSRWMAEQVLPALTPNGSVVVALGWRFEDDLADYLIRQHGFSYINLPARQEGGAALWPERWTEKTLLEREQSMGPLNWRTQWMGEVVSRAAFAREAEEAAAFFEEREALLSECLTLKDIQAARACLRTRREGGTSAAE